MKELIGKTVLRVELSPGSLPKSLGFVFTDSSKLTILWTATLLRIAIASEQLPKKSQDSDPEYQWRMMTE